MYQNNCVQINREIVTFVTEITNIETNLKYRERNSDVQKQLRVDELGTEEKKEKLYTLFCTQKALHTRNSMRVHVSLFQYNITRIHGESFVEVGEFQWDTTNQPNDARNLT